MVVLRAWIFDNSLLIACVCGRFGWVGGTIAPDVAKIKNKGVSVRFKNHINFIDFFVFDRPKCYRIVTVVKSGCYTGVGVRYYDMIHP